MLYCITLLLLINLKVIKISNQKLSKINRFYHLLIKIQVIEKEKKKNSQSYRHNKPKKTQIYFKNKILKRTKRKSNPIKYKQLNNNQVLIVLKKQKLKHAHKARQNKFQMKRKFNKLMFICNFLKQKKQPFFINFLVFFTFLMTTFNVHQDSLCFTQKQYTHQLFQYYFKVIICSYSRYQQQQLIAH
ncbi:hypothetical protein TTHERM_001237352 (macronuclear) [Tetrahymena thermophila SB210]|uniref:Transmembrane protein n=1 Tax=Tetrahymena thermophila (strain SB210) TaxID=312017 RepID=W7XKP0_TETTS|nr:hypothetical protein TTHERM_001237352 [Tetrahymena thermophila SB210]EWS76686.1 hypothetical protein TTHERM_001237352 [Tetrahymena thermophila SB210]|eukprot:XP_012650781.1 hypothetical protein TTHERM_001237352 [Tetrahymena thermophila SB210]